MNPLCSECYPLRIPNCEPTFKLPTGLPEGTTVWGTITDKFGNQFAIKATVDSEGNIELDKDKFPPGLFTPYSGFFAFVINGTGETEPSQPVCENVEMTICDYTYTCIVISVVNRSFSDHTTPVVETCICGISQGQPDIQIDDTNDELLIEISLSATDFQSEGVLESFTYSARQYIGGILNVENNGSLNDGDNVSISFPDESYTVQLITIATFDDGSSVINTQLIEVRNFNQATYTRLGMVDWLTEGCNTISAEASDVESIGEARRFQPGFINGNGEELAADLILPPTTAEFDESWSFNIAFIFGVTVGEWSDLPEGEPGYAGQALILAACVDD